MAVSTVTEPGQNWVQRALAQATRTPVIPAVVAALGLAAIVTYIILASTRTATPLLIIVNSALVLLAAARLAGVLVQIWTSRRAGSAGARLHGRLVMIFGLIAIIPAVL